MWLPNPRKLMPDSVFLNLGMVDLNNENFTSQSSYNGQWINYKLTYQSSTTLQHSSSKSKHPQIFLEQCSCLLEFSYPTK